MNIWEIATNYYQYFLRGTRTTILISLLTVFCGSILGCLIAFMRLSKFKPLEKFASIYITVIRGTPMLVQLYIVYYQLDFISYPSGSLFGVDLERALPCIIALSINSSAYVAEIIRAGIQAVDKGQMEGARSCGMTNAQAMRYVVMPQAVKNILPAIGNEFVTMVKETSIIQYLGIGDLMYNNGIVVTSTYNPLPCYYISAIIYLALNIILGKGLNIPYGIDISILSDPETVLPFCILDGTLITAMRTSAVGGLMAKYAAPSNADTACLVGAGVIGRTMISAVHEALPQIKTMYLCDIDVAKAEGIAKEYGDSLGVEIIPTSDSKAAALKSQLIVGETTEPKPFMDTSWLTPGCGLVSMHSNEVMEDVFLKADGIVADYWTQLKQHTNPLSKLTKEGKLDESQIMDLSELVLGTKKLRTSDDQFVAAASMGLGALDIMIAYQLYLNATEMGIGTKVNLWDKPLWE